MSQQDIIIVGIVAIFGVSFLCYVIGLTQGQVSESRRKVRQEVTATYTPYCPDGKHLGYVKVYKGSAILGDDDD